MKKISHVVILELVFIIIAIAFTGITCMGYNWLVFFIDIPSLISLLIVIIPGLLIMGKGKDFIKAFSVGTKDYTILELKDIIQSIDACQKLTLYGALLSLTIAIVAVLIHVDKLELLGPNLAVAVITIFYTAIIELLLLPLKVNADHTLNKLIDMEMEE